jgi:uncharacterized membrane protein
VIAKYISVALASTLKFTGGPLMGAALGLTWIETAACTVLGMMLSVSVVMSAGELVVRLKTRFQRKPAPTFSRRTRLAVRVWQRTGVVGIALLTPLLLTPIGGTALAVSFRAGRLAIWFAMLGSAAVWAALQTILVYQIPGLRGLFGH